MRQELTAERLREVLHYDPLTGVFMWIAKPTPRSSRLVIGAVAGYVNPNGYRYIGVGGRNYRANRLAWLYVTGKWPAGGVDHRNLIQCDDRWANLREATHAQNGQNCPRSRRNTSGVKGVSWLKRERKWRATICVNRSSIFLGHFSDINEAAAAYAAASDKYHGEYGRTDDVHD